MRSTNPLLGLALGILIGGLLLEAGMLVLLALVPFLIWAAREPTRPLGLAGLLAGMGVGIGGLLAWADARCSADPSCTIGTDPTPYFVVSAVLALAGAVLAVLAVRRLRSHAV